MVSKVQSGNFYFLQVFYLEYPSIFPQEFIIDYVRVYKLD